MLWKKHSQPKQKHAKESVSIEDSAACQKSLRIHIGHDVVMPVRTIIEGEFQKQAALPGFRKGRAPMDLIGQRYAGAIHDETLNRVTKQTLEQVAKDHKIRPVGPFEVGRAEFDQDGGVLLEAKVEVEPLFELGKYKGISLVRKMVDVTPDEIDKGLVALQESMAQMVPTEEGKAKERRVPPLDNDLAKDLGFETLENVKTHFASKLRDQKRQAQEEALEADLCGELLKRHDFEVPPRLVIHQTERLRRDFKTRLLLSGTPEPDVEEKIKQFEGQLRQSAEQRVRFTFVLDRIAKHESVNVTEDEIVARLWKLAQQWKKDPVEVRKIFDDQGLWQSVISAIRQEKTIAALLKYASIEDQAVQPSGQPS